MIIRIVGRDDDPADPVAVSDPRFERPYDDSDGRAGQYQRTREGWADLDYDRNAVMVNDGYWRDPRNDR